MLIRTWLAREGREENSKEIALHLIGRHYLYLRLVLPTSAPTTPRATALRHETASASLSCKDLRCQRRSSALWVLFPVREQHPLVATQPTADVSSR